MKTVQGFMLLRAFERHMFYTKSRHHINGRDIKVASKQVGALLTVRFEWRAMPREVLL